MANSHRKTRWTAIGRAGGPGTFWDGYEYELGTYPYRWIAWLRAWWHVAVENPMRVARIAPLMDAGPAGMLP